MYKSVRNLIYVRIFICKMHKSSFLSCNWGGKLEVLPEVDVENPECSLHMRGSEWLILSGFVTKSFQALASR